MLLRIKSIRREGSSQKVFRCLHVLPKAESLPDNVTLRDLVCVFALALLTVDFWIDSRVA